MTDKPKLDGTGETGLAKWPTWTDEELAKMREKYADAPEHIRRDIFLLCKSVRTLRDRSHDCDCKKKKAGK